MTKEERLMQAIGMLPEEMIVQEDTEELKKYAKNFERKEVLCKRGCILATVAACLVLIITAASINKNYNIPDKANDASVNIGIQDKNSSILDYGGENKTKDKEGSINCFVMADTGSKKNKEFYSDDNSKDYSGLPYTNLKKALHGRTVKLQIVKDMQNNNSSSKKKAETEYIVFSFDQDCYFNVSGFNKTVKIYIMDMENGKKHYIKEGELCKAGKLVYIDISGVKVVKDSYKENIKAWDKKGIEVIASTEIYQKPGESRKKAGVFYIGIKQKKKNNKERNIYYGRFENES